jgi:hypothetical protein
VGAVFVFFRLEANVCCIFSPTPRLLGAGKIIGSVPDARNPAERAVDSYSEEERSGGVDESSCLATAKLNLRLILYLRLLDDTSKLTRLIPQHLFLLLDSRGKYSTIVASC